METKICPDCKTDKPVSEFNKNPSKADGLQYRCRECQKAWYKNYYSTSPKEKARILANNAAMLAEIREVVRVAKEVPCADCKKSYPYWVMDFDHLEDKVMDVSKLVKRRAGISKVKAEIEKCEVVCSNCHRNRTHSRAHSPLV